MFSGGKTMSNIAPNTTLFRESAVEPMFQDKSSFGTRESVVGPMLLNTSSFETGESAVGIVPSRISLFEDSVINIIKKPIIVDEPSLLFVIDIMIDNGVAVFISDHLDIQAIVTVLLNKPSIFDMVAESTFKLTKMITTNLETDKQTEYFIVEDGDFLSTLFDINLVSLKTVETYVKLLCLISRYANILLKLD